MSVVEAARMRVRRRKNPMSGMVSPPAWGDGRKSVQVRQGSGRAQRRGYSGRRLSGTFERVSSRKPDVLFIDGKGIRVPRVCSLCQQAKRMPVRFGKHCRICDNATD